MFFFKEMTNVCEILKRTRNYQMFHSQLD